MGIIRLVRERCGGVPGSSGTVNRTGTGTGTNRIGLPVCVYM